MPLTAIESDQYKRGSITVRELDYALTGIEIKKKLGSGNFGEVFEGIAWKVWNVRIMEWNY